MVRKIILLQWLILPILTFFLGLNLGRKQVSYFLQKDAHSISQKNIAGVVISKVKSEKTILPVVFSTPLPTIFPSPTIYIQTANSVWNEINKHRLSKNLNQLNIDQKLCEFAKTRLESLVASNSLHHNGFSELTNQYMSEQGFLQIGENLSQGFTDPAKIVSEWGRSDTHKILLETPDLNLGCVVEKNSFVVFAGGSK